MQKVDVLKSHLKPGRVYRRAELAKWSTAVDRHAKALVDEGTLEKVSAGIYYYPKKTAFGNAPAEEEALVRNFLKDDRFLLTSPNAYNGLGVGTTQLYNTRVVYNHKRHGDFELGKRTFSFRVKPHFPSKLSEEFLLVDLVDNLKNLAEEPDALLKNVREKAKQMDARKLKQALSNYGGARAKKVLLPQLEGNA